MSKSQKEFFICIAIGVGVIALNVFAEWTKTEQLPAGLAWVDLGVQALFAGLILWGITGLFGKLRARRPKP